MSHHIWEKGGSGRAREKQVVGLNEKRGGEWAFGASGERRQSLRALGQLCLNAGLHVAEATVYGSSEDQLFCLLLKLMQFSASLVDPISAPPNCKDLMVLLKAQKKKMRTNRSSLFQVCNACKEMEVFDPKRFFHDLALKASVEGNIAVENALVDMYRKVGNVATEPCFSYKYAGATRSNMALSEVPDSEVIAEVQIGLIGDKFIVKPTIQEMDNLQLDLLLADTENAMLIVEKYCDFFLEDTLVD
ncbi:hypothetical protein HAX54_030746 [Datura stramonium]|uniref:Uncharacterized protein n=1 Tax=Datura stramonium TaxID=4076 RepID=A0ABS8VB70_DATST|nr:hypothetical protein [Datura stramonium]